MKTYIYIDSANIGFGCKNIGLDLNYEKFFLFLKSKFKTNNIKYFAGYIENRKNVYDKLSEYGFLLQFKEVTSHKGILKGNVDAEIVLDVVLDILENKCERIVLCSGDGDFACLIKFALERNVEVWVIAPQASKCSYLIRKCANKIKVIFLDNVSKSRLET